MKTIIDNLRRLADEMEQDKWSECDLGIIVFRDASFGILTVYPLTGEMLSADKHYLLMDAAELYTPEILN